VPLTEDEKVKIRHHLGFLNVAEAMTFVLGTPAAVETQFLVEGAMNRVLESALVQVRRHVQILDTIEQQKIDDLELLAVTKVGEIEIRQDEQEALDRQYERWQASLANLLGIYPNPWDKRNESGFNVPVMHG
jgi:predicted Zn-dependent protease